MSPPWVRRAERVTLSAVLDYERVALAVNDDDIVPKVTTLSRPVEDGSRAENATHLALALGISAWVAQHLLADWVRLAWRWLSRRASTRRR